MTGTLMDRKEAALERLMAIDSARRGQLSEQYYTRKCKDGKTVRQGPYYVWQRYVKGKKRSVRISAEQIEQVKAELELGDEVDAIFEELWSILEESALGHDQRRKKSPDGSESAFK